MEILDRLIAAGWGAIPKALIPKEVWDAIKAGQPLPLCTMKAPFVRRLRWTQRSLSKKVEQEGAKMRRRLAWRKALERRKVA